MNTILTRLSAELIEKYEAEGFWRGDTFYGLVRWHAQHTYATVRRSARRSDKFLRVFIRATI